MASEGNDEGSVLGNLPRQRPGRRSTKRTENSSRQPAAGATASRAGTSARTAATARKRPAAKAARSGPRGARADRSAASSRAGRPAAASAERQDGGGFPDPIGEAVKLAGKVAGLGFKTAGEILKRLPGR